MNTLPKAILFDLDETIISFGSRRLILQAVIEEFADLFAPVTPEDAGVDRDRRAHRAESQRRRSPQALLPQR